MPAVLRASGKVVRVGALLPLTGDLSPWGLPGKLGSELWAERVNKKGGIDLHGEKYTVELVAFDSEYIAEKTLEGARSFLEQDVKCTMIIGGDDWSALQDFSNRNKMLTASLYVSDLNPSSNYLLAPVELHPFYLAIGLEYLVKQDPHLKTIALCAQDDLTGRSSLAYWRAGFDAYGLEMVSDEYFDNSTTDFSTVVSTMLSKKPQAICLDTMYPPVLIQVCQELHQRGYKGRLLHAGWDLFPDILKRTSKEFVEGAIGYFPRFDDPEIDKVTTGFEDASGFYKEYMQRHPNSWNNTSWEYAAILEVWKRGVEAAGTFDTEPLLTSMKANPPSHIFGPAKWWGKDLFGIDNALVGNWPVVEVKDGQQTIVGLASQSEWFDQHRDIVEKRWREEELMPDQRR